MSKYGDRPTLIWDLDDTLVECGVYYRAALKSFGEYAHARLGIDAQVASEFVAKLDRDALQVTPLFNKWRFPRSFKAASLALDIIEDRPLDFVAAAQAFNIGAHVLNVGTGVTQVPYILKPGAVEMLKTYSKWQQALYTLGDVEVQEQKIRLYGLREFFGDNVFVVPEKSVDRLETVMKSLHADLHRSWLIGDSLHHEIIPAHKLGLAAVHVFPADDTTPKTTSPSASIITNLRHLSHIVPVTPPDEDPLAVPYKC